MINDDNDPFCLQENVLPNLGQCSQIPELKAIIVSKLPNCYYYHFSVVTDCPYGQGSVSIAFEQSLPEQRIR